MPATADTTVSNFDESQRRVVEVNEEMRKTAQRGNFDESQRRVLNEEMRDDEQEKKRETTRDEGTTKREETRDENGGGKEKPKKLLRTTSFTVEKSEIS